MHWVAWMFWISISAIAIGAYLVDFFTGRKYAFNEQEKSLNQDTAITNAARQVANRDIQNLTF